MASSRSVVPAMGLLGVTGGAGAGGEVKTAVSGVGSRTSNQTHQSQASPSPRHAPCLLNFKAGAPPTQLLPWTLSSEVLLSSRSLLLLSPNTRSQATLLPTPCPPPPHRKSGLLHPAHLLASSLHAHLQGSPLWAAPSGVGLGWVRAQARVLVRLGLQAPSRHWPCLCSGSYPRAPPHWGSPLPHPSSEPAPWVMQWCLGGMVVLGAEHDLALG